MSELHYRLYKSYRSEVAPHSLFTRRIATGYEFDYWLFGVYVAEDFIICENSIHLLRQ